MQWYILSVQTGQEPLLARLCRFETYLPTQVVRRFIRQQRKTVYHDAALIPGYLFVLLQEPSLFLRRDSFRDLARARPLVRGFLRNGDLTYAILTDLELQALRRLADRMASVRDSVVRQGQYNSPLGVGQLVKITSGPFSELAGVIRKIVGGQVVLELPDVRVPIRLPAPFVEPLLAA
jgi:transcription antitermination factor NusG